MTLAQLAKEFRNAICEQEGYEPVSEEWILREFHRAIQLSAPSTLRERLTQLPRYDTRRDDLGRYVASLGVSETGEYVRLSDVLRELEQEK